MMVLRGLGTDAKTLAGQEIGLPNFLSVPRVFHCEISAYKFLQICLILF